MTNAYFSTHDEIADALTNALAKHARRDIADHLIDALYLEPAGPSGAWYISFVVVPECLEHDLELATADVHLSHPRMKLAA